MLLKATKGAAVAFALAALAIGAAPASASVAVPSFNLNPSTTQAGSNPDLNVSATFAPTSGDDPQSVTLSLAAGLLANPTVPTACSESQLQGNSCPSTSQVGTGTVTGSYSLGSISAPAKLYLVQPHSGEAGRVGMVATTPLGNVVAEGPVTVRTTPDVGANVTFDNLPRQIGGFAVTVTGIKLTLSGTVNGQPFTRNPTSCGTATTTMTVTAYSGSTTSSSSAFTPTGCGSLPFGPKLSASASVSSWEGATELDSTISQTSAEAATKQASMSLPFGLKPRWDVYSHACGNSDPSSCPASATVGSATVNTPLSATPLTGRVVLVSASGGNLGLDVVFPAPFPITLTGTTSLTGQGLTTTFSNMPDVPLTNVAVKIDGGSDSLLINGYVLCGYQPTMSGSFTGQNGASATASAPVAVSGCSGSAASAPQASSRQPAASVTHARKHRARKHHHRRAHH